MAGHQNTAAGMNSATAVGEEFAMSKRIWAVPILVVASFGLLPNYMGAQKSSLEARSLKVAEPERAKEIYRRDCMVCHGANGAGKTDILRDRELNLPNWTDPKSLDGRADQQLFNVVRFGRGKMPAEAAGRADDAEVRGLISYIRALASNEAKLTPEAGATRPNK
jgi:mono/diheme cytochrome c family protein